MNEEQRKEERLRYLERVALREARKAMARNGRPPTKEELLVLKVRTWPRWLRILLMIVGGVFLATGFILTVGYHQLIGVAVGLFGFMIFFLGWWGRRQTVGESFKGCEAGWLEVVLETILAALD